MLKSLAMPKRKEVCGEDGALLRSARRVVPTARTHRAWLERPVSDDILRKLYDLLKMGPTSTNCCPARFVFVRSKEAKERLAPALNPANVARTMTAPVTAIVATDTRYHEHLPKLWPHDDTPRLRIVNDAVFSETKAFRNSTLQGGYLIFAARALGLDCGPLSGFNSAKVDEAFFLMAAGSRTFSATSGMAMSESSTLAVRGSTLTTLVSSSSA